MNSGNIGINRLNIIVFFQLIEQFFDIFQLFFS